MQPMTDTQDLIAWHKQQVEYFEPFGGNNTLVIFHRASADALEQQAKELETLKIEMRAYCENYPNLLRINREQAEYCDRKLAAANARIAELEKEVDEQCRLNGMGASREAALIGKLDVAERRIAELEQLAAANTPHRGARNS
jgi:hypothetical protein